MAENTRDLEPQVEAMLEEWALHIDDVPGPTPDVLDRVKAAVRHQVNEEWLASQPSPSPRPAALQRVRAAVRQELARSSFGSGRSRRWLISPRLAGLAAAAMLIIGVGIVQWSGYLGGHADETPTEEVWLAAAEEQVDLFVEAAQVAMGPDAFSESILNELEIIQAKLARSTQAEPGEDLLNELDAALREILESSPPGDGLMDSGSWSVRVIG